MKENLKEERMMILEMVKDGKISADDAVKLLEGMQPSGRPKNNFSNYDNEEIEEKFNKFYQNVDGFAKDLKSKLDGAYRDVEPKIKSTTKKIMEKTACAMEDLSKSISDSARKMEEKMEEKWEKFEEKREEKNKKDKED